MSITDITKCTSLVSMYIRDTKEFYIDSAICSMFVSDATETECDRIAPDVLNTATAISSSLIVTYPRVIIAFRTEDNLIPLSMRPGGTNVLSISINSPLPDGTTFFTENGAKIIVSKRSI